LATSISPIFNGLERGVAEPVTVFSFLRQAHHRDCQDPFCAQILCSQASCLHFRQF
jgi:hypothetical protein